MDSRILIKKLRQDGWYHVKTVGSHHHFKHPIKKGKVTIPHPRKDLKAGTVRNIHKQAGWI